MRIDPREGPTGRENGEGEAVTSSALTIPAELSLADIWRTPLPHQSAEPFTRLLCRCFTAISRRYVQTIEGPLEALLPGQDPCVLVLNHNQRLEAILVPTLILFYRGGKPIHFFADWSLFLIPGLALIYRRSRSIVVTRKSAKPRFLNVLKPLFEQRGTPFQQARDLLASGAMVGVFPEGKMNRNPRKLLRGRSGAARLALEAGVPVQPVGISFPGHEGGTIRDGEPMILKIGRRFQLPPPAKPGCPTVGELRNGHGIIMKELAALSGKIWPPREVRKEDPCP